MSIRFCEGQEGSGLFQTGFSTENSQKKGYFSSFPLFVAVNGKEGKNLAGKRGKKEKREFFKALSSSRSAACPWIPLEFSGISILEEQSALLERQLRSEIPFSCPKSSRIRAEKAKPSEI